MEVFHFCVLPIKNSIGKEQRSSLYRVSYSPGPGAYEHKQTLGKGPKYSAAARHSQSMTDLGPGPGAYAPNTNKLMRKTTFGFTMPGRKNFSYETGCAPGPGAYNISSLKKQDKMCKFGKDARRSMSLQHSEKVPGPGAYTPKSNISRHPSSPHFSFGLKTLDIVRSLQSKNPGPGAYEHTARVGREGTKSTILPRRPLSANAAGRVAPGPGAYEIKSGMLTGPKYKIGLGPKCELLKELVRVPGPGAYNPLETAASFHAQSPHWGIGTAKKGFYALTERTPGPGSYEHKVRLGEGQKYSMRPRTAIILTNGPPGPGQYNPKAHAVKNRPPTAAFGKSLRDADFSTTKEVPGPGSYMHSQELKQYPAYKFGRAKKLNNTSDENAPGPGAYKIPVTIANPPNYLNASKSHEFLFV